MIGPPASPSRTGAEMPGRCSGTAPTASPRMMPMKMAAMLGSLRFFFGVAEHLLDVVHRRRFAHDDHAVADLQYEARRGQQRYAAAVDAADVDPVAVSQPQRSNFFAVDFGAGDDDRLRDQPAVDRVPVDVLLVPVGLFLLAEERRECLGVLFGRDDQQPVALLQLRVGGGDRDLAVAPQPRDDEGMWLIRATSRTVMPNMPGLCTWKAAM